MIGVVIVNFGSPKDTLALLARIKSIVGLDKFCFAVIDNGSPEKDRLSLLHGYQELGKIPRCELIVLGNNLGFSGGNNVGINYLMEKYTTSHICLINNDTLVTESTFWEIDRYICQYPEDMLGCTLIYESTGRVQCLGGAKFNQLLLRGTYVMQDMDIAEAMLQDEDFISNIIDYVSGAFMIIPSEFFRLNGLLNESYFLYYEEIDLAYRFKKFGKIRWCKDIIVLHKEGGSINGEKYGLKKSYISEYHSMRSSIIFAKIWLGYLSPALIVLRILTKTVFNLMKGDVNAIKFNALGIYSGIKYDVKQR